MNDRKGICARDKLAETECMAVQSIRLLASILALIPFAFVLIDTPAQSADDSISRELGEGMAHFVARLDEEQRDRAFYAFDDDERFDLRLAPLGLEGLKISEMSDDQWAELEKLFAGVLSPVGLEKMNTIRSLEREVAALEGGLFGFVFRGLRDAERYFLAIFGEPTMDSPWGLRFDGHHLSLNWTAIPGAPLSATPLFFGGQPRLVPDGLDRAGLRVLAEEEDVAVAFLNGLSEEERQRARIRWKKGSQIRRPMSIGGEVDLELGEPRGLSRAALEGSKRARLDALVEVHLANFAPAIANRLRAQMLGVPGGVAIVYAAADPLEAGRALYYRIEGGGLMIEFDNTSKEADHIHVVLRNPRGDFGRDALAEHLARHHAP